jgi:hypothetical protein
MSVSQKIIIIKVDPRASSDHVGISQEIYLKNMHTLIHCKTCVESNQWDIIGK